MDSKLKALGVEESYVCCAHLLAHGRLRPELRKIYLKKKTSRGLAEIVSEMSAWVQIPWMLENLAESLYGVDSRMNSWFLESL